MDSNRVVKRAATRGSSKEAPPLDPPFDSPLDDISVGDLIEDLRSDPPRMVDEGHCGLDVRTSQIELCNVGRCSSNSDQGVPCSTLATISLFDVRNPKAGVPMTLGGPPTGFRSCDIAD